ncbi:venom serine protease Bi-VSP isoform X2 [Procambarus clarkii]|uniref:venom serine protease Bi-VSP isoform X2 n=1 Tax=Procambarus clarkii TaxID=6728 RepID=UPI001E6723FD|nr:venom serine protease Bi-VSP-like isoform X2 [Procambarus clarkii]
MPPPKYVRVLVAVLAMVCWSSHGDARTLKRVRRQAIVFNAPTLRDPEQCRTPNGVGGRCVILAECPTLFKRLTSKPSQEDLTFLRSSICRFEKSSPLICCTLHDIALGTNTSSTTTSTTTTSTTTTSTTTTSTTTPSTTTPSTTTPSTTTPSTTTLSTTSALDITTEVSTTTVLSADSRQDKTDETPTAATTEPTTTLPPPTGLQLLSQATCGISEVSVLRIVGGTPPPKGLYPWLAALGYADGQGKIEFLCGAALLTHQHVVTAAHCVRNRNDLKVVRLGEHDLSKENETVHEDFGIQTKTFHANFNPVSYANDIAIIKLDKPVTFRKGIKAVCLPLPGRFHNNSLVGIPGIVAGWGAVSFNNVSSPELLHVMLPVISQEECALKYTRFRQVRIDNSVLCAGVGGKDACQGDSGGPMVMHYGSQTFLTGIVSFGFRCAEPNFPGVYTKVSSYLDWILTMLN